MKAVLSRQLVWVGAFAIFLICSCAPLIKRQSSVSTSGNYDLDATGNLQNLPKIVEREIPEFRLLNMQGGAPSDGKPSVGQIWLQGKEYVQAVFVLRNKTRYHPLGEFPRETKPVPYIDIAITVTRFDSPKVAHDQITKEMRLRPATPMPKENYKGAWLYRFTSGGGTVICQSGQYVIEINPNSEAARPFTLGLLDVALAQIKHVLIKSN
jgi:hypothetical protein